MRTQGRKRVSNIREMVNALRAVIPVAVVALGLMMGGAAMAQVTINPSSIPAGPVAVPYSQNFSANGGAAPYTFSNEVGRLPNVLTLTPGGTLSGTPQLATVPFEVWVTDANGRESRANSGAWTISYALTLTATFSNGTVNQAYSASIGVTGGTASYTCSLFSGSLPAGLTTASNCVISGTPTTAGTYTFMVQATDSGAGLGIQAFTFTVGRGTQTIGAVSLNPGTLAVGGTTTASATASSGLPVVFRSASIGVCTVSGNVVAGVAAGLCSIGANQSGNSNFAPASEVLSVFSVIGLTVPGVPTILSITPGPGRLTLTLRAPSNTGGGPIATYVATCSAAGYPNVSASSTTTTVVVTGLVPGVSYACTATASNASHTSAATPATSAIPKPKVDLTPILMLLLD
jgi:hypothetical protein